MKKQLVFLTLFLIIGASISNAISSFTLGCWIIDIETSCGRDFETQYCDEGRHGEDVVEWAETVDEWACGH